MVLCAAQEDPDKDYGKKDRRREEERRRKAARSGFVRDLVQELEGAPEEVTTPHVCLLIAVPALCALALCALVFETLKRASPNTSATGMHWLIALQQVCSGGGQEIVFAILTFRACASRCGSA